MRPNSSTVRWTSATTCSSTLMSVGTGQAAPPRARPAPRPSVRSRSATVRAAMTMSAPCSASSCAVAAPMPGPAAGDHGDSTGEVERVRPRSVALTIAAALLRLRTSLTEKFDAARRGGGGSRTSVRSTVAHMFESRWDAGLDEAQLAAVTHGDEPLIVLAGAGTGQDPHADQPGRPPARARDRAGAHPAADVHPPRRRGHARPRRRCCAPTSRRPAGSGAGRSTPSPTGWWPSTQQLLGLGAGLGDRPGRRRRPARSAARRAWTDQRPGPPARRRQPASPRRDDRRHLLAGGQHRPAGARHHRRATSRGASPMPTRSCCCSRTSRAASAPAGCSTSTTCCCRWRALLEEPAIRRSARRPMGPRPRRRVPGREPDPGRHRRSAAARRAAGSPSSATTPRRCTASAARPAATC